MSANLYAPPKAPVADIAPEQPPGRPPLFAVSLRKLLVMSLFTLNFYQIYWFYQHWRHIKSREGSNISPVPRALFAVLYCYQCCARVRRFEAQTNGRSTLRAGLLALAWTAVVVAGSVLDRYGWVSMSAVVFLLPVQAHANTLNAQVSPSHDQNKTIRGWNWLAVLLGAAFLLLALVGLLIPAQP